MRKVATIREIEEIKPIEGADAIEAAAPRGWVPVTDAARDVLAERQRQISAEGWRSCCGWSDKTAGITR